VHHFNPGSRSVRSGRDATSGPKFNLAVHSGPTTCKQTHFGGRAGPRHLGRLTWRAGSPVQLDCTLSLIVIPQESCLVSLPQWPLWYSFSRRLRVQRWHPGLAAQSSVIFGRALVDQTNFARHLPLLSISLPEDCRLLIVSLCVGDQFCKVLFVVRVSRSLYLPLSLTIYHTRARRTFSSPCACTHMQL
jgi:hypothetical protein